VLKEPISKNSRSQEGLNIHLKLSSIRSSIHNMNH
jgi:hypothetical protein